MLLKEQNCQHNVQEALSGKEIEEIKPQIPEWNIINEMDKLRLQRTYEFRDFLRAAEFLTRMADLVQKESYYPNLNIYQANNKTCVTVEWYTENINRLHINDFIMAAKTNEIYKEFQSSEVTVASEGSFPASDPPGYYA